MSHLDPFEADSTIYDMERANATFDERAFARIGAPFLMAFVHTKNVVDLYRNPDAATDAAPAQKDFPTSVSIGRVIAGTAAVTVGIVVHKYIFGEYTS